LPAIATFAVGGLLAFFGSQPTMIMIPSSQQGQRRCGFGGGVAALCASVFRRLSSRSSRSLFRVTLFLGLQRP